MNDTKQWLETSPTAGPVMDGHADFETRIRVAQPGEQVSYLVGGAGVCIDRDASIAANREAIRKGDTVLGKAIDALDIARHATMRFFGR